ncbi:membrane protein insertase YidC [Mesomycoplasma conjunctivae]|uniref:membrane protein insertase YidC n=1 Tax=Mesomycoplasma conjunctivae TaxID=45361 RepID=UPI003DA292B5
MSNKHPRPKAYEFFNPKPNKDKKKINFTWKGFWKVIKIFLYTMIFSFTLTGCIQSFVVKSSSNVGEGTEFYQNDKTVIPNYTIFKKDETNPNALVRTTTKGNNFLISADNNKIDGQTILESLKKQSENNGSKSTYFGDFSSLIIFENEKGFEYLRGDKNNEFLFFTSADKQYIQKNNWTPIFIPSPKFLVLIKDEKFVRDGLFYTQTELTSDNKNVLQVRNIDKFFYKLDNKLPPVYRPYSTFARDVFQSIYNKILTLDQFKDGKLEALINKFEAVKGVDFDANDFKTLTSYANTIKQLLPTTNFTKFDIANNTYTYNLDEHAKPQTIAYQNKDASRPIVTWGDSWKLGPFYSIFVYPLSKIILSISESQSLSQWNGWITVLAIVAVVVLTKTLSFIFRFKTIFGQSKQLELQAKKAKIDAKYEAYQKNKVMQQRQRQEIAELYKKNNFSPFAPFSQVLVTTPIFIAVWRVLQGIPSLKVTFFLGLELSATSYQQLFAGQWIYLPILILVVVTQALQQLVPKWLNKKKTNRIINASESEAMKKQLKTQRIITIVFIFFGVVFQTSLQIYWIIGGIWEVAQSLGIFYLQKSKFYRDKMQPFLRKKKII